MRRLGWIFRVVVLNAMLTILPHQVAKSEGPGSSSGPGASQAAVDGLNAKIAGFGGATNGQGFYGGEGSVTVPLGFRYGLQVDGLIAGRAENELQGNVTVAGAAAHLFWRDPSRGLLGAYGHYVYEDALNGIDIFAGGIEGALYWERFTVEGVVGVDGGEVDTAEGSFDIDTRFFDVVQFSYYPGDNLKLSVGHSYTLGENAALFGVEWGFNADGRISAALFASGRVSEEGDGAGLGGLRFYFSRPGKTLIRRQREDDPSSSTIVQTIHYDPTFGCFTFPPPPYCS